MNNEAVRAVETIEKYVECCFVKGSCAGCPFWSDGKDWLSGRCMGTKKYGQLLLAMLKDVRGELEDGKKKGKS